MKGWQALNLILFSICFSGFSWSIYRHFKQPAEKGLGMQMITGLGSVFMLAHISALIFFYRGSFWQGFIGAALYFLAVVIFWSAIQATSQKPLLLAYSKEGPEYVLEAGPYRWIRHPFYTSYTLAWSAGAVSSGQPLLWITAGVMFFLYFKSARREEKQFAEGSLKDQYRAYQSRSGMFFPRLFPGRD